MVGFIFDATKGETPGSIAKKRAIAEALAGGLGRAPKDVGEGLTSLGNALAYRMMMNKADKAETAGREGAAGSMAAILSAFGGGGGAASAGAAPGGGSPAADGLNPPPTAHASDHERDPSIAGLQIKGGIEETAKALGIDPIDLATAISYETGGTFDPTKAGPTTQYGQHKGFIQFGEPQAKEHGVDWNNPVGSQLGANGAVASYLRKAGVQPGMGLLDIYSAINAGGVGRYNASDANNGGAPGTVADKVNQQMAGHRAKALAMFGGGGTPAAPDPIQVASLDPSAGVAQATAQPVRPMPEEYAKIGVSPDAWARMNAPDAAPAPQQAPAAPAQQIAQVLNSGPPPQGSQSSGPTVEMLMQAAQNPWLSEGQRGIVNMLLQKEMQKNDPAYQMGIEKDRLELDALRNPRISPADQARLDMDRQKLGFEQKDSATDNEREAAKLKLDQEKFANESALSREKFDWEKDKDRLPEFYDAYVQQEKAAGREPLGILDYVTTSKKAGATNVTTTVGEGDKFYENLDKKNAETFSALSDEGVRGNAKLAQIDRLEGLLATAPQGAAAMLKQAAGEYGINTEGLSDIQAAQALINELVPQQRQPGSGPMSDADLALFKQSLPRLINQPGGNQTIIETMRGITQYQIQMGQIADKVADRDMTPKEAREAIRALPNPLASFGKPGEKKTTPAPSGVDPSLWNEMTPEERALWN